MSLILTITKAFSVSILSEWLVTAEFANFDTSLCNLKNRIYFLGLIEEAYFESHGSSLSSSNYLSWLVLRRLKVSTLFVNNFVLSRLITQGDLQCLSKSTISLMFDSSLGITI